MSKMHPLEGIGLASKFFKCFGDEPGGFEEFAPINIIIGRNNSGKSAMIDIVDICLTKGKYFDHKRHSNKYGEFKIFINQRIDERSLKLIFREGMRGGGIPGPDHWVFGKKFIGLPVVRSFDQNWDAAIEKGPDLSEILEQARQGYIERIAKEVEWPLNGVQLIRIAAERDVRPEQKIRDGSVTPNGNGVTNLVRAFINTDTLPRSEVEIGLLNDLNSIYKGDCEFTRIACREDENDVWEIFLSEEAKGDIRLSQSGSSLKSIFIILSTMRLMSQVLSRNWAYTVLSIEEPENNLHPALLRRLLNFLAEKRERDRFTCIIATHSPVAIDWASRRNDSQIIHVRHSKGASYVSKSIGYAHGKSILEDLDVRASDILQSNCIIWVEGPSDRIYVKRWIELVSGEEHKEGIHYTIMFYGGKLLSHLDALPPGEDGSLISLMSINKNAALLMDSDRYIESKRLETTRRRKPRLRINATKLRIKAELEKIGGFVWITEGREIENYVPIQLYAKLGNGTIPDIDIYTQISELQILKRYKSNKVSIAHDVVKFINYSSIENHLDLLQKLNDLCFCIKKWNGIV